MRRAWADRVVVYPGPAYQHGPVAVDNAPHVETALRLAACRHAR
jgi:hypothetical protein